MKYDATHHPPYLWLLFLVVSFSVHTARGQHALEEIRIYEDTDTRCLSINNAGVVGGYYISPFNGKECGFVITPTGRVQRIDSAFGARLGYGNFNHYRVTAVSNDTNHTILIRAAPSSDLSSSCTILKGLYNPASDAYDTFSVIPAPTTHHPHSNPTGINYYGDLAGWYQSGGTGRFLWYVDQRNGSSHNATRVQINNTPYRTFTGGINDSGLIAGAYYDDNSATSTWKAFSYDIHTYNFVLFTNQNIELKDVNNQNVFVGTLGLSNNTRAYMATANGATLQSIPLTLFRPGLTMQSELNGINDDMDVVGAYRHPNTNTWVGFVFRTDKGDFRIPGFNFAEHTWKLQNTHNAQEPNAVWTSNYWGRFDYVNDDPYAQNGIPLLENSSITSAAGGPPADMFPSWVAYMEETDALDIGTDPVYEDYYQKIFKPFHVSKHLQFRQTNNTYYFKGICYGFTYTALQRHLDPAAFSSWFGLPQNYDISQADNTEFEAIKAIERTQLKSYDQFTKGKYGHMFSYNAVPINEGMRYLKNTFSEPRSRTNPKGVSYISGTDMSSHMVMPWKIKTPQAFPFEYNGNKTYDSLFVYDSNYPEDSTRVILVPASHIISKIELYHDSTIYLSHLPIYNLSFNHIGVRPDPPHGHREHSSLKPAPGQEDPMYSFSLKSDIHYTLTAQNKQSVRNAAGWQHDLDNLNPVIMMDDTSGIPAHFFTDTTEPFGLQSSYYGDSLQGWSQGGRYYQMHIHRKALPGETDNGHISYKSFAYGTHDPAEKILNGTYSELSADNLQGVNIMVKNLTVKQGDSLITRSPAAYQYQIIRLGGDDATYDLTVFASDGAHVRETVVKIPIKGNATHSIDPYYDGAQGSQTVIYVDNGNTGSMDDTLLLDGTPPVIGIDLMAQATPQIKVYPSPVQSVLHVHINNTNTHYQVTLSDLTGKHIDIPVSTISGGLSTIPTGSLAPGVYVLQIYQDQKLVFREKIVKQ